MEVRNHQQLGIPIRTHYSDPLPQTDRGRKLFSVPLHCFCHPPPLPPLLSSPLLSSPLLSSPLLAFERARARAKFAGIARTCAILKLVATSISDIYLSEVRGDGKFTPPPPESFSCFLPAKSEDRSQRGAVKSCNSAIIAFPQLSAWRRMIFTSLPSPPAIVPPLILKYIRADLPLGVSRRSQLAINIYDLFLPPLFSSRIYYTINERIRRSVSLSAKRFTGFSSHAANHTVCEWRVTMLPDLFSSTYRNHR